MRSKDVLSTLARHRMLVLALLGLAVFVPFLGWHDMWYPDEPDVGEVARAMYLSGDWIAPRRNGEIWVDYPPMVYWAGSLVSHLLGGVSEFSLRLPSALTAIAVVLLTCAAGTRLAGPRAGFWAGLLLLTFVQFAQQAIGFRPDMHFTLWIAAGLLAYAAGAGQRPRWWLRLLGFALLGLAVLSKGPLGLLLPGLVLTLWHGTRREWRRLLELAPLALVTLAVSLPWFIACARAMGTENILGELYAQNFQRFQSGSRGHEQPPYYFLERIWVDILPWSFLLPFALWWLYRSGRWRDRRIQLLLWWFAAFFAFLSAAVTKRQLYLQPAYPAIALLMALWIDGLGRAPDEVARPAPDARVARVVSLVMASLFVLVGLAALIGAAALGPIVGRLGLEGADAEVAGSLRLPLLVLGALTLGMGWWTASAARKGDGQGALLRLGLLQLGVYAVAGALLMPAFNPTKTYVPAATWIREHVGSRTRFGMVDPVYGVRKMGAFTFYSGILVDHLRSEADVDAYFTRHPDALVLVNVDTVKRIFATPQPEWPWPIVYRMQPAGYRYAVLRSPTWDSSEQGERPR